MRILLSGGGTMGSVSPLVATYQEIKKFARRRSFFLSVRQTVRKKPWLRAIRYLSALLPPASGGAILIYAT